MFMWVSVGVGMVVAEWLGERDLRSEGGRSMKGFVNSFMQLLLIIMSLVTLAVSTAAVSMFLG